MKLTLSDGEVISGWRVIPWLPLVAIWLLFGVLTCKLRVKDTK